MSINDALGLPRDTMRTINIAFDVDGTLRCNGGKKHHAAGIQDKCDEHCQEPNDRIVMLFNILSKFKNVKLWVWSGGGKKYAEQFARVYDLPVKPAQCISKLDNQRYSMDIAIDDIQDTALARINLIVREK